MRNAVGNLISASPPRRRTPLEITMVGTIHGAKAMTGATLDIHTGRHAGEEIGNSHSA